MATIKSYTDLEQSKKLADVISLESADMFYYPSESDADGDNLYTAMYLEEFVKLDDETIPCWSLAALMKIIEIDKSEICFDCYGEKYRVNVHYQTLGSFCQDNELYESKIDALFAMIIKLHKRNLL